MASRAPRVPPSNPVPLAEVAARLGLSPKTVKRMHREDGLPLHRLPNDRLVGFWIDIEAWIRTCRQDGKT